MAQKKKQTRKGAVRTLEEELEIKPRWKDVLLAFYNKELFISREWVWKGTDIKDNPSVKKLGLSEDELIHALFYLKNNGLIESRQDSLFMELSGKGFDVAVKIEGGKSAARTQSILVFVMLLIAVTGAFQFFSGTGAYDPNHLLGAYVVILILIVAGMWGIYKKFGP